MQKTSLTALARHELAQAQDATSGRSAKTLFGGHEHHLRQTLIALRAGQGLSEHENPGEATLQVLHGRITLKAAGVTWNGSPGDLITIPDGLHSLDSVEDSVVLLTVSMSLTSVVGKAPLGVEASDGPHREREILL